MNFYIAGTVEGKLWKSDGALMVKGKAGRPKRTGVRMDSVYVAAIRNLKPLAVMLRDKGTFSHLVYRTVPTMQVLQPMYRNFFLRSGWKLFIGGKFNCISDYRGERYIVAKHGREVVAILAPMRKP